MRSTRSRFFSASKIATKNSTPSPTRRSHQFRVSHSNRYIPDRFLPDKAIDLVDEAGARVKLRQTSLPERTTEVQKRIKSSSIAWKTPSRTTSSKKPASTSDEERKERENLRALREKYHLDESSTGVVNREDIEDVVSRWTGVPITSIKEEETQKLLRIEEELHKRIISQDKSISALARAIRRSRAGLKNPNRPIGSFLFLGPRASAKPKSRAPWRNSCSAPKKPWSASTCPNSWRNTRSRS